MAELFWNIARHEPTIDYEITLKTGGTIYGKIAMADENATAIEVHGPKRGESPHVAIDAIAAARRYAPASVMRRLAQ